MKRIICYSTGKDSTALALWAKEIFSAGDIVLLFDDTLWEHDWTYAYLEKHARLIVPGSQFVRLVSEKYPNGMRDLVQIKKRVPSVTARFCTSELKVIPTIKYLRTLTEEYELYDGRRSQESKRRAKLKLREWSDDFDCWVNHPILHWSHEQCFAIAKRHGVDPNPLYLHGAGRVGCFPCVLINHRELKACLDDPELGPVLKSRCLELENLSGRSFFPPGYIPERFQTGHDEKTGKPFPWAEDVFRYVQSVDMDQLPLLPVRSCTSIYNLCEI